MNESLDDYDFTPSTNNSNLASLFDASPENPESSSLIYTAPKQPKVMGHTDVKNEPVKGESSVLCARVVLVWKLIDNKYNSVSGKHGLAIIGSSVQNSHEMILYKEKRNVIVRVKLHHNFEIFLKKDNFCSFYDGLKENWLIKFNNEDDCSSVVKQIENFGGKITTAVEASENLYSTEKQENTKTRDDNVDNSENRAKADILSRIAKMGLSILPNKNLNITNDTEHENRASIEAVPVDSSENRIFENKQIISPSSTNNVVQVPRQHVQNLPNTFVMGQPMVYDPLNLYFAEGRAHNSEVRLNLSHISEKLNHILQVVDNEKPVNNFNSDALKSKVKVLELRGENLSRELITYQEENAKLKLQISQQKDLLQAGEQSKIELSLLQEQETAKITEFQMNINTYKDNIKNLSETVEKQKMEIDELKKHLDSCEDVEKFKNEISEMNNIISNLKLKLKDFEESHQKRENSVKLLDHECKEKTEYFIATLKESMNGMYGNIMINFNEDEQYQTSEINSIIAQNIKSTTLKIIQNFQHIYRNEPNTN